MMRFFTLLLFVSLIGTTNAQNYIWGGPGDANSEFDGGLNDWTVNAVSPNADALWLWEEDARTELGAYHNNRPAISSPSAANGAMGFDSDFYDNEGIQGNFGAGIAAAPQQGELISPVIDCSGQEAVSVAWYQYMRQFTSTFSIDVTNDGGMSWTSFPITENNDWAVNSETPVDMQLLLDISSVAANQSEVQFKFVYNANYYFWLIDDVALVETPANNLVANSSYLSPAAWSMPESIIDSDTLDFAVEIINVGSADNMGGTVTAEIVNSGGTAVHTFTEDLGMIPSGDTVFFIFDAQVFPEDIALTEGTYTLNYIVETIDEDFNVSDNTFSTGFVVSADEFSAATTVTNANAFTGEFKPGVVFRTSELADNQVYQVNSVMIGGFGDQDDPATPDVDEGVIQNAEASVYFFKVKNQLSDEFDPIYAEATSGIPGDDHSNLEYVGFGFFSGSNIDNFSQNPVEVFNDQGTDVLQLEENTSYLVCLDWNDEQNNTQIFSTSSQQLFYYQQTNMVWIDQWFTLGNSNNGFLAWAIPVNMTVENIEANGEVELEANAVSVYPNPAVNFTAVDLNFNEPTSATIVLSDALGGFISSKVVENVTSTKVEFNVESLPAGTYNFQITTTNNEVATRSLIIVE